MVEAGDRVEFSKRAENAPYRLKGHALTAAVQVPYGKRKAWLCETADGQRELVWCSHLRLEKAYAREKLKKHRVTKEAA